MSITNVTDDIQLAIVRRGPFEVNGGRWAGMWESDFELMQDPCAVCIMRMSEGLPKVSAPLALSEKGGPCLCKVLYAIPERLGGVFP